MKFLQWIHSGLWVGTCLLATTILGCGPKNASNPAGNRGKTMILHLSDDPAGLNPVNTVGAATAMLHNLVFDHLIGLNYKTLELEPKLAAAMPEISEDRLTYTFELKKGLTFADGKPLTSRDVVFSYKALMNPFVSSAPRRAELHNFEDCIAIDDLHFKFVLSESGPFNLNRLAINFFVIPKHIYDPLNLSDGYSGRQAKLAEGKIDSLELPGRKAMMEFADFFEDEKFQREKGFVVGSGRYIFDGWKSQQNLRFVKNEHYWGSNTGAPFDMQGMDTLLYKIIPDPAAALQALKSGEIDFSDQFEPSQFEEKMSGADFETHFDKISVPYPFYEYIGWNANIKDAPKKVFFADPQVRMALSKLVDVNELIQSVLYGTAEPITSMVYKDRKEYNTSLKPIGFDEKGAKAMLAAAGWQDSDGDGILDKMVQGEKVPFEFSLNYRSGNELRKRVARHVQDRFKKAGIKVEVQELDGGVLLQRLKKHEIEAWVGGWVYDSDEQDQYALFHSSQILNEGYNWGSYVNAEADSLMERITVEWDQEKRYALHRRVQAILYQDQPYTLLFANSAKIAWNKRLKPLDWYSQRPCYDPGQFQIND